jgi:Fe-S cluster biogenesis protein NfuA
MHPQSTLKRNMNHNSQVPGNFAKLETLLEKVEQLDNPAARDTLQDILQGVLEFHGLALARLVEMIKEHASSDVLQAAAQDVLVSSLLALHDLHPLDLRDRVEHALDTVRPYLKSHGGAVELLAVSEQLVQVRMDGSCHGCPSSAATLKDSIEQAIFSHVPEIERVEAIGVESAASGSIAGFVPLTTLALSNGHKAGV